MKFDVYFTKTLSPFNIQCYSKLKRLQSKFALKPFNIWDDIIFKTYLSNAWAGCGLSGSYNA